MRRYLPVCAWGNRLQRNVRQYTDGPFQLRWLRDEEYLLGTRLGRRPTQRELFVDFMNHRNGRRFRAYFALKYPDRMKPKRTSTK